MYRKIENTNPIIILKLLTNIKNGIISMINDYTDCYSSQELVLLNNCLKNTQIQINKLSNKETNIQEIYSILQYEDILKELSYRCWILENNNGTEYIHWFKKDKINDDSKVISTTFGENNSFCNARYGIKYDVSIAGFLGAFNKDAATIIENKKPSIYTIGITEDNKVINSYNLATPIITPIQVFDHSTNDYKTKYNEIILDKRYIKPKSIICTNENDINIVTLISKKYNIPIEYKTNKESRTKL